MDLMFALRIILWLLLAWMARRHRLFSKYKLFFSYVAVVVFLDSAMPFVADSVGRNTYTYLYIYVALKALVSGIESVILLKIYWLFSAPSPRKDWHLVAVPIGLFMVAGADQRLAYLLVRMAPTFGMTVGYFGTVTLYRMFRSREVQLGWNLKMVLFGLTVPTTFQSIFIATYLNGFTIPIATIDVWLRGVDLMFWVVIVVGMSEYSPPRRADGTAILRPRKGLTPFESNGTIEKSMKGAQ